jgi:hypothetical protein
MSYGWLITVLHVVSIVGEKSDVDLIGPSDISQEHTAELASGKGCEFRMYDDDGELYCEGRWVGDDYGSEEMFGPLDDYGLPNGGAVRIDYKNAAGVWETL